MHPINKQQKCSLLFCLPCFPFIQLNFLVISLLVFFNQFTQSKFLLAWIIFLITSHEFSSTTHCYYISYEMFTIYCGYFPVYSEWWLKICLCSKLMRPNTITVQGFLLECFFVRRLCKHLRISWMEKNWKFNLIKLKICIRCRLYVCRFFARSVKSRTTYDQE